MKTRVWAPLLFRSTVLPVTFTIARSDWVNGCWSTSVLAAFSKIHPYDTGTDTATLYIPMLSVVMEKHFVQKKTVCWPTREGTRKMTVRSAAVQQPIFSFGELLRAQHETHSDRRHTTRQTIVIVLTATRAAATNQQSQHVERTYNHRRRERQISRAYTHSVRIPDG